MPHLFMTIPHIIRCIVISFHFLFVIILGAGLELELVWNIADTLNGFMAVPNLIALLGLSGVVIKMTKDFFAKDKQEK